MGFVPAPHTDEFYLCQLLYTKYKFIYISSNIYNTYNIGIYIKI